MAAKKSGTSKTVAVSGRAKQKPAGKKAANAKPAPRKSVSKAKPKAASKPKAKIASKAKPKPVSKALPKTVTKAKTPSAPKRPVSPSKPAKHSKPVKTASSSSAAIRETASTINTGNGAAEATSQVLRDHAGIAKGIAERKAAAKAKSIARLSRPAIEKNKNLKKLTPKQSREYEAVLLRLRDEISRQIAFLRGASLTRTDEVNPEEDGSDAFERQLALKLASTEGDAIFEIDEALQRIKDGTYGICQDCSCVISPARLKALPFARRCVECKAVAEKGRDLSERRYF